MEKKLQRDENSKMIGGVAAGLAEYFDVDATWVRIGFFVITWLGGSGILAYIVLWIVMPAKPFNFYPGTGPTVDYKVPNAGTPPPYSANPQAPFVQPPPPLPKKEGNGKLIVGCILLGMGFIFLFNQFGMIPFWFSFHKLWPLALIIPGILILAKAMNKPAPMPDSFPPQAEKEEEKPSDVNTNPDQTQNP